MRRRINKRNGRKGGTGMKKFLVGLILLKVGFVLGILGTLFLTKSKLMIDIGVLKDAEEEETEDEQD
jgi:hypothetical protein